MVSSITGRGVIRSDAYEGTRLAIASGPMSPWQRMNPAKELIYVTTPEGNMVALTRSQVDVFQGIRRLAGTGVRASMRHLAELLGVSPSTVYRATIKLTAYGFIAYQSNRGRYGGTVYVIRKAKDGLDWCRDAAKATVRRWAKATAERFSRLISNVAPYPYDKVGRFNTQYVSLGRNIKTTWTPEELRDVGII